MKKFAATMLTLAAIAGGCESSAKKPATASRAPLKPAVTDIAPTPPAGYVTSVQPIQPVQPVAIAPAPAAAVEPAAAPAASAGGSMYTVQKGDTLYKIARERYGDGKQWQKIASANPGLSPSTLKVGQKIAIP